MRALAAGCLLAVLLVLPAYGGELEDAVGMDELTLAAECYLNG